MKIERASGARGIAASAYARRRDPAAAAALGEPASATTSILGIPEAEFTPSVRDAIMGLMQEVDALRRELEHTRARLDTAERNADQDHLLPLLNRRAFVREVTRAIGMASRYGTPASLVYFDLDGFKQINDAHGHAAGDAVLLHFAETLMAQVRDSDVVGRIGGDEFGVILSHASQVLAHKKAASLAETLTNTPAQWQSRAIPVSFSYGTFELKPGESADHAIARADEAMYAHKKSAER
jgi:diguanylate cyclase (GGDEF)-like protein